MAHCAGCEDDACKGTMGTMKNETEMQNKDATTSGDTSAEEVQNEQTTTEKAEDLPEIAKPVEQTEEKSVAE